IYVLLTSAFLPSASPPLPLHLLFSTHPPPPPPYTLSLHDALPICAGNICIQNPWPGVFQTIWRDPDRFVKQYYARYCKDKTIGRSEEHTSELQSLTNLVCRLLLERKISN